MPTHIDLKAFLQKEFGLESFRPKQEEVIKHLLDGKNVVSIFPTGYGKSLLYQLTSQLLPGLTIVVSPLIALMKDQIESIEEQGIEASEINSLQSAHEVTQEFREVKKGKSKILYVTPERLSDSAFLEQLKRMEISLFVVDEAHTISEWGHDFRPSYLILGEVVEALHCPPVLALTATATPLVINDIKDKLHIPDALTIKTSIDRPNLFFDVLRLEEKESDEAFLQSLFSEEVNTYPEKLTNEINECMKGSGIIYVRTTKEAEETVSWLCEWGIQADYYHGQRSKEDRDRVQNAFMNGAVRVIAATNAFGLGVDKADIRFIIHRDIPANLESYYQEAGRSGRDGHFARCLLVYRPEDLGKAAFLSAQSKVTKEDLKKVYKALQEGKSTYEGIIAKTKLSEALVIRIVEILKKYHIVTQNDQEILLIDNNPKLDAISLESEENKKVYEQSRFEMMRRFAELSECRRVFLLNYFGENYEKEICMMCDNDTKISDEIYGEVTKENSVTSPFLYGAGVLHDEYGKGIVIRIEKDSLTILFDTIGYQVFDLEEVINHNILQKLV